MPLPSFRIVQNEPLCQGLRVHDKLPGHSDSFPDAMRGADGKCAMAQKPKVGQPQSDTSFIAYTSGRQIDLHVSIDLHAQARSAPTVAPSSESFPATRNPDPH